MEFSQNYACPEHGVSIDELSPRMFSFNNPFGACETCTGLGTFMKVDPARVIPDPHKSIRESAIKASGWYYAEGSISEMYYKALGKRYGFTLDTPIKEMSKEAVHAILYGTGTEKIEMQRENMFGSGTYMNTFEGIIPNLERRFRETGSEWVKEEIALVMSSEECPTCHGQRLKPTSLAVTVGGINIAQFCDMSVNEELEFIQTAKVSERDEVIAASIFKEVKERLGFLKSVGLGYLTLSRGASSLSGGESQRIRLATQIGSALTGVLYVLDEPSIGLHPANITGLTGVMQDLIHDGNSVILVDHDTQILSEADWLIEMGPQAGAGGGQVIAQGSIPAIEANAASRIGPFLAGKAQCLRPQAPQSELFALGRIQLSTNAIHTVKPLDIEIPKGRLTVVTGVSGSGKTTLVLESLVPGLNAAIHGQKLPEHVRSIVPDGITQVKLIDAAPIGINVRSTVATYANVHDELRKKFAATPDARQAGYKAGDFSYNTGKLRCPVCDGTGSISLDVQFLPDVEIPCPECRGSRYAKEAGQIFYTSKSGTRYSLPQLMDMDVNTALTACADWPVVRQRLTVLQELGLGYLTLGEETPGLSGGEAQRTAIARALYKDAPFVILDEPTAALDPIAEAEIYKQFSQMTAGKTAVYISHRMSSCKFCDRIIVLDHGRIAEDGTHDTLLANHGIYANLYETQAQYYT